MAHEIDNLEIKISADSSDAAENVDALARSLSHLAASASQVGNPLQSAAASIKAVVESSKGVARAVGGLSGLEFAFSDLGDVAEPLRDISDSLSGFQGIGDVPQIKDISDALRDLSAVEINAENIKEAANALSDLRLDIDKDQAEVISQVGRAVYDMSGAEIPEDLPQRLTDVINAVSELSDEDVDRLKNFATASAALQRTNQAMQKPITEESLKNLREYVELLREANQETEETEQTSTRSSSIVSRAFSVISGAAGVMAKGVEVGFKAAAKGVIKLASSPITSIGKKFSSAASKAGEFFSSIKRVAMYRAIRSAIKAISDGFAEGRKNLYYYSQEVGTEFAQSMDKAATSALYLKNSIGAATAPLTNLLVPIIDKTVDKIVELINRFNEMTAVLTGASSWTKAVKYPAQWQDSLDDANKSAKKLKSTMLGFDELNVIEPASTSGSSSASDIMDYSKMFEEVRTNLSVSDDVIDYINRVKEAFQSENWYGLGETVADGLNFSIRTIDDFINNSRSRILDGESDLIDSLNGLTDRFNAYELGSTLGNALNLAVDVGYNFFTEYDFDKFGLKTAEGLNGLLDKFDGFKLGQTLAAAVNSVIDFGYSTLHNFKWEKFGERLGEVFNGLFGGGYKKSDRITKNVGGAARNAYLASMEAAGSGINWHKLAETFSEGIKGVLTSLSSFLETTDAEKVGAAIVEFLDGVDWDGIAQTMNRLLGAAIGGIGGLIKGAFEAVQDKGKKSGADLYDEYGSDFKIFGNQIANGVANGVIAAWKKFIDNIYNNFFKPFADGLKKSFGIASPAKKMKPYGNYISEGIKEGISENIENVYSWIKEHIFSPFSNGLNIAFGIVGGKASGLLETGKSIVEGVKSGISSKISSLTSIFKKEDFEQSGENITSGIGSGIVASYDTNVGGKVQERRKWIQNAFDASNFRQSGENIASGIGNGIQSAYDTNIGGKILDRVGWIQKAFDSSNFVQSGLNIAEGIGEGLRQGFAKTETTLLELHIPAAASAYMSSMHMYASGGFPEAGELFIANEAGPELVGKFGNRAGVMNNQQIVEAVSDGVYRAASSALAQNRSTSERPQQINLYMDRKQITTEIEQQKQSNGVSIFGEFVYT